MGPVHWLLPRGLPLALHWKAELRGGKGAQGEGGRERKGGKGTKGREGRGGRESRGGQGLLAGS